MIWILTILLVVVSVFGYIQLKARIKNQKILYEMMLKMHTALKVMRKVDSSGAFEAHDIVGQTFVLLVTAIEELRNYFAGKIGNVEKEKK